MPVSGHPRSVCAAAGPRRLGGGGGLPSRQRPVSPPSGELCRGCLLPIQEPRSGVLHRTAPSMSAVAFS